MNKSVLIATLLAVAAISLVYVSQQNSQVDQFQEWKLKFGTQLASGQEPYRRLIFEKNLQKIQAHNAESKQTYKMGINQFSIYSQQEFVSLFLSEIIVPEESYEAIVDHEMKENLGDVDWSALGKVSPIKDQGQCGSCWAFSATGVIESQALMKGSTVSLSEQQLVDCSKTYGNQGCNGGFPALALRYVKDHGIASESQYPYKAVTSTCQIPGGSFKINQIAFAQGCGALQTAIYTRPISVTVDATNWSSYRSGVFNNCDAKINHAVLLVGVSSSQGFWKIKNSWSAQWGQNGYIRLASGNTCGVCVQPSAWVN